MVSSNHSGNSSDYLGIGAGLADAAIGVMMLTDTRKVKLEHTRNVLRELWAGTETSSIYPPSIWYYLNYKNPNDSDELSLREQLIENWQAFGQISSSKKSTNKQDIDEKN